MLFCSCRGHSPPIGEGMGSEISKEEKHKRESLENNLNDMQRRLETTSIGHFESSQYYQELNTKIQYISSALFFVGVTGSFALRLGWGEFFPRFPSRASFVASLSATCVLTALTVNGRFPWRRRIIDVPADLYQKHFNSGVECQYLESRVKFMSETEVWDPKIPWASLALRFQALLREKRNIDSVIKPERWAYQDASKVLEEIKRVNETELKE